MTIPAELRALIERQDYDCEHCNNQRINCWVWMGNSTGSAFYNHAHFEQHDECPFCAGALHTLRAQLAQAEQEKV